MIHDGVFLFSRKEQSSAPCRKMEATRDNHTKPMEHLRKITVVRFLSFVVPRVLDTYNHICMYMYVNMT